MRTYGASVTPSPSAETEVGRRILAKHLDTTGSLGSAISEAVEKAVSSEGYRYVPGSAFIPSANHAGGLRYHGMSSTLSELYHQGLMEAVSVKQTEVFEAAESFARVEGILPAPESSHAIRIAMDEALRCKETGEAKTIVFGLTGTGYFDMVAYEKFHEGEMDDYIPTDEELNLYRSKLPKVE